MSSTNPFKSKIALVDCNNFFVSCERLFDPKLHNQPVVVLSSNDGCVVSRSKEAKDLQIPMGAPFFKWKEFFAKHRVIVRSSNFALYSDLSHRVLEILYQTELDIEIYSIDEAFLFLGEEKLCLSFFEHLRAKILKWTGIPVSFGIAPTKTLAKAATKIAKKNENGVFEIATLIDRDDVLSKMAVGDIWGIGRRLTTYLHSKSLYTAFDLIQKDDLWVRKHLSVTGLRTVLELRGMSALTLEEQSAKHSIMTSRSFGTPLKEKEELLNALTYFATRGGQKLRDEKSVAAFIDVFIMTSPHGENFIYDHITIPFPESTNYTPELIAAACKGLEAIFRPNLAYKKGGVLLGGLTSQKARQMDLLATKSPHTRAKEDKLMEVVDGINQRYRQEVVHFGLPRKERIWKARSGFCSPSYTTQWDELLMI